MKICLDPGHGGRDNGASKNSVIEDNYALFFANRLAHYIRALGSEVVMTRESDVAVGLGIRAKIAVQAGCDVFLAIHCNASGNALADGVEAFYAPTGKYQANSKAIGEGLCKIAHDAGMDNRGVKPDNQSQHPSLTVLRNSCQKMPAVLIEIGFVTNGHDAALMKNARWAENLAEAWAKVLVD